MTISESEACEFMNLLKENGIPACGGSMCMHSDLVISLKEKIASGDPVVVSAATAEIVVDAQLDKLETYIIGSDGIASNWVTYFFEVA